MNSNYIIHQYNSYLKNKKNLIKSKKPTLGGYIIIFNIILYFIFNDINKDKLFDLEFIQFIFLIILILVFLIGAYDDLFSLSPFKRLISISILLFVFLYSNVFFQLTFLKFNIMNYSIYIGEISIFFTIICFLVLINSFNMFDGINGQSGFYFIQILIFLYIRTESLFLLVLIISILSFLILNLNDQIFFGDSGIYVLSIIFGIYFIYGYQNSYLKIEEIFLICCIPIYDLIRLFGYRIYLLKNPLSGDKNHIHHLCIKKYGTKTTMIIIQLLILSINISLNFINIYLVLLYSMAAYLFLIYGKANLFK